MIYLDNNATTQIDSRVAEHLAQILGQRQVNPASQHAAGRIARSTVEDARDWLLKLCKARTKGMQSDSAVFTSGGTESNNLALCGLAAKRTGCIVVSAIEHPSILATAQSLQHQGREVRYLPCKSSGQIDLEPLREWIARGEPIALVSLMLANNETGVLQPVSELAALCKSACVPVHTDAVQAFGKIPVDFDALDVQVMTLTAHKFHGPVGVGGLLVRHSTQLEPMFFGGFQQASLRPGTESPALASSFAFATELAVMEQPDRYARMLRCRELLESSLLSEIPDAVVVGALAPRLPHTTSLSFPGLDRQLLQLALDREGIACGTGSACASGSSQPSHVLQAMGLGKPIVQGAIRLSLSWETSEEQVLEASERITRVVHRLRTKH
ncbi:MAG: cysteine desulfurase family protein [Planctomycetota bacterium]|nr:cysteine desulfurase family protein [Planctomycetota bacterium]